MLQCVAVCCSVLQCVAVCCSVLQCVAHVLYAVCPSLAPVVLQYIAVGYDAPRVMQCVAACCSLLRVLQCVACVTACCIFLQCVAVSSSKPAVGSPLAAADRNEIATDKIDNVVTGQLFGVIRVGIWIFHKRP